MDGITLNLNFITNGNQVLETINNVLDNVQSNVKKTTTTFSECYKSFLAFGDTSGKIDELKNSFNSLLTPGIALNRQMADLSSITGVTSTSLKEIEIAARDSAKAFGIDASQNVNTYKLILLQLSPEIAKSSEAIKLMGNNVNILSKTMGGDTVAATEVLTTAMNQYSISTADPIAASKTMTDMMNVMTAAAKEGSAELPQIKQALEQVGRVAKNTGVSFVDTNAAIQMLDKSGKKGAEGGIALRNVLTTLSEGRFATKEATKGLADMHISTAKLADASIPLTDRLRMLKPIMENTALMTKIFGKENIAASVALIKNVDKQDALAKKITGTNTAVKGANVVMGSYQERMNRATAIITDLKIGFFNATQQFAPFVQGGFEAATSVANFSETVKTLSDLQKDLKKSLTSSDGSLSKLRKTLKSNYTSFKESRTITLLSALANKIYAKSMSSITSASRSATLSVWNLNIAMLANPVGLIVIGIMALIGTFVYLWNNCQRFREILFGIWEAAKAVFHNIGVFFKRIWDTGIKPIINAYGDLFKFVWGNIWGFIKWVFNGIAAIFVWLYDRAVAAFTSVKDFVVGAFNFVVKQIGKALSAVGAFFSGIWNWFTSVFSGFVSFIDEWLVQPIKNTFGGIWDWIVGLFDKIMDKLTGVFAPIKNFFKTLFSSEGMVDVKAAYKEGEKKGTPSYKSDHAPKSKPHKAEVVTKTDTKKDKNTFDVTNGFKSGAVPPTKTIAGVGAKNKDETASGGSGSRSLTIGKLIENMTLHFHGTVKESKESIKQSITEALLTTVNDVNLAN